ncbi:efflux RND transporter permease subunit [Marinimicrococcus flavescens]|uniref:Efflux pump membrane transporter n=1 Tax=Marinimicrococcus flavescens TaxID=3031815 RepID=A0AAP3XSK3_9PROT|nr:multidrug efflux RND transporter permease subunit [Marinimicrococcus flavescens]
MRFAHFFVDRPIFATVVSILITLLGGFAYFQLPVAQYPEVAPPTIVVSARYPGASAEVAAETIATPLEQEINGVEGMLYMLSQSTGDGSVSITVTFALGTDLDAAQVLVQNRVAIAEARLPEEVRRQGVQTKKNSPDFLMAVNLSSPDGSLDQLYISNYATLHIEDVLARLEGVGQVQVFGARDYSMRLWLDPDRMAALELTTGDVVAAVRAQNVNVASGVLNQEPVVDPGAFALNIETLGRLPDAKAFEQIIVKTAADGRVTRLRDIARVELGAQDYLSNSYIDGRESVTMGVFQRPGSNALDTAATIRATMDELAAEFPAGMQHDIAYDTTRFIAQSVEEVEKTIYEAVVLVVLVVVLFLQSWRAAIIPILAIPVSLIGTFAIMAAAGFSLNTLSLFGLVLAIGIVVDDAIVVVENVERNLRQGMAPREAAHRTMDEVGGALVAIALVLSAVFIPAAMVSGIQGQFFRQFAITIAAATIISAVVSLTLSPALCALLLKPHDENARPSRLGAPVRFFFRGFNRAFDGLANGYAWLTGRLVRVSVLVLLVYGGLIGITAWQFERTPEGFIPSQDQGYAIGVLQLPAGATLQRTDAVVREATRQILEVEGVAHAVAFAGFDGATFTPAPNAGAVFITLEPFSERIEAGLTLEGILGQLQQRLFAIEQAFVMVIPPPPVQGIGTGGGFKMMVEDRRGRGLEALEQATQALAAAARKEPALTDVFTLFNTRSPKVYADIDRVKAEMLGVPVQSIFETLQVYLGSAYVNDFSYLGRTYRVTAQADGGWRREVKDIADLETRNDEGRMVPLGSVTTFETRTGPYRVPHFNLYPAAEVQGAAVPGVSSGEALAIMERLAEEVLPDGFAYEWTDLSYQEKQQGNTGLLVFGAAVVFVFLLLAAQYESWLLPLAVILIVPMCLLAGVTGVQMRGMDINVLVQIGFVVLVGLAAKNAILIVEFARQAENEGQSRFAAAVEAARTRLRPIIMTSLAFILGVVPLLIAQGAGAENRQALGTAVFSGMLGVTLFGLLFTPVFYVVCRWLGLIGRRRPAGTEERAGA